MPDITKTQRQGHLDYIALMSSKRISHRLDEQGLSDDSLDKISSMLYDIEAKQGHERGHVMRAFVGNLDIFTDKTTPQLTNLLTSVGGVGHHPANLAALIADNPKVFTEKTLAKMTPYLVNMRRHPVTLASASLPILKSGKLTKKNMQTVKLLQNVIESTDESHLSAFSTVIAENKEFNEENVSKLAPLFLKTAKAGYDPAPLASVCVPILKSGELTENKMRTIKVLGKALRNTDTKYQLHNALHTVIKNDEHVFGEEALSKLAPIFLATKKAGHNPALLASACVPILENGKLGPEKIGAIKDLRRTLELESDWKRRSPLVNGIKSLIEKRKPKDPDISKYLELYKLAGKHSYEKILEHAGKVDKKISDGHVIEYQRALLKHGDFPTSKMIEAMYKFRLEGVRKKRKLQIPKRRKPRL